MKQLYSILLILLTSLAFSQATGTVDFETGGTGADWSWTASDVNPTLTIIDNPYKNGNNTSDKVVEFVAKTTDNNWALAHTDNVGNFTFDATNNVVKIMVYKTNISDFGIKFEGPNPNGGVIASSEIKVANTTTNAWEELTFTFPATDHGKTFNKIVLIPDFVAPYVNGKDRTADSTVLFDNLQTPLGPVGEPFKVFVDMTDYMAEKNITNVGVTIRVGPNWGAELNTTNEGNNIYSYTFYDIEADDLKEYGWIAYPSAEKEFENLLPKIGGGAAENAVAAAIPANEALNTDYSSYCNRTIRSNGTGFSGKTYMFNSTKVSGVSYTELTVDTGTAGQNIVIDYSLNNWSEYHGPGTTDNGDGTYTAIVDPTQAFEYKWNNLTTTTVEDLTSCNASGSAMNVGVDENNIAYANRVQAAGENKSDVFGSCPANPLDAYALYVEYNNATDIDSWTKVADASSKTSEVVFEHVTTGGNPDGAFKFGGVNSDGVGGRAYIFEQINAAFDYKTAATAKIQFDLKQVALAGTALHFSYETLGGGFVENLNIQNDGLNGSDYTTYTFNATTSGGTGILKLAFNFAAGAAVDLGGSVLLDNLRVTLLDGNGNTLDVVELKDSSFNIYPNPVQNTLYVNAGATVDNVSIFDLTGRQVLRAMPNAESFSLDVSNLNKGMYLVSLKAGDQEITTKLVK